MNAYEQTVSLIFLVFAPLLLHFGVLRGANFYPQRTIAGSQLDRFLRNSIMYIVIGNGVILATSFFLWSFLESDFWFLPLIIGIPSFAVQVFFLAVTAYQDMTNE